MNSILYSLSLFAQAPKELTPEEKAAVAAGIVFILFVIFCIFCFYNLLLLISFYAFRRKQGFWGNTICAFNISFATIIAISFHEGLASLMAGLYVGLLFYYEYLAFMILFLFSYFMLARITNGLSKVKVRFPVPIEVGGNILVLLVCYAYFVGMILAVYTVAPVGILTHVLPPAAVGQVSILSNGPLEPIFGGNPMDMDEYLERKNAHHAAHAEYAEKGNWFYDGTAPSRAER